MDWLVYAGIILGFVFGIIVLLFLIAVIRAIVIKKEYPDGKPFNMETDGIKPERNAEKLSEMLKVATVSVRGSNDKTKIYEFHEKLEQLFPLLHKNLERIDIDGALLFRWKGKNPDKLPILLMSHQDVVEAVGNWKHGPFSGDIAEGKIWGRGAVDTKGALCAILESVEILLEEGFVPFCDVYIASSNNEEITGDGAVKTVEYLYEKGIRFGIVMDEGGLLHGAVEDGHIAPHNAMIGVVEKGRANIKFTAHSRGGHASVPFNNNPFARLSKLVYNVEYRNPFKKRLTKPVLAQYKALAPYMRHFRHRLFYGNLWFFYPIAPYIMHKIGGQAGAVVKTTCIFTMAQGSHGANVIPETASMTANMRFMLHEPLQPSYKKMAKLCHKLDIEMEMITGFDVLPAADTKCYSFKYLQRKIKDVFGEIPQIPYIFLAGTDARHYSKVCDCVVRFVPLIMTSEQISTAHAPNENLYVEALSRGVLFYHDFIRDYGSEE